MASQNKNNTDAGDWIVDVFKQIFYQPDDAVSEKAIDRYLSSDIEISINGNTITRDVFLGQIREAREIGPIGLTSSHELHASTVAADAPLASVGHTQTFTLGPAGGPIKSYKTMTICTVATKEDGKREVTRLVEITAEQLQE